jgi:aspartyl-tRNA(Asn)/glutamyl-tRNA(Gln) amidotransferase subunit A
VHRARLERSAAQYDPWVRGRLEGGRDKTAADYIDLLNERARIRASLATRTRGFDALALPTVPIAPPALDELGEGAASRALNALILRNTAIANFLDRPAISIPCHAPGEAPAGLMLMGETGLDRRLLAVARGAEEAVRGNQA